MRVSGHTKAFAVLGHPIGHTLSPVMHNAAFEALGMDAIYLAFDVHPERLMGALPAMQELGFGGVNLTVPLKEVAFRGLSDLDESARRLGAVNTVVFTREGRLRGCNTDGCGFLRAVEEAFATAVKGLNVFVLGCGGAGRAVALACAATGVNTLTLTDADEARPSRVMAEIAALPVRTCSVKQVPGDARAWEANALDADLVVQATPVGMKPGDRPLLGPAAFRSGQMAFDLVYMYPETAFMRTAREGGAKASNGLGMLLHQGVEAFSLWTGVQPPVDVMRRALEREVYNGR